ncbi:MAG: nuclear transport factor 2 family protein [Solirubrobacterales bacterium]|nr:nuclear transport factor 2 family protein [Solirubrobacterales bacterium]
MQDAQILNVQALVRRYIEAFNETEADRRRELLEALYTADCTYTDPHVDLQGADQIDGFIAQTQERFPGLTFTLGGPIDAHHDQARFQWHAGPADAPDAYVGFDVIVTDDGRIRNVYGFMDATPAA